MRRHLVSTAREEERNVKNAFARLRRHLEQREEEALGALGALQHDVELRYEQRIQRTQRVGLQLREAQEMLRAHCREEAGDEVTALDWFVAAKTAMMSVADQGASGGGLASLGKPNRSPQGLELWGGEAASLEEISCLMREIAGQVEAAVGVATRRLEDARPPQLVSGRRSLDRPPSD